MFFGLCIKDHFCGCLSHWLTVVCSIEKVWIGKHFCNIISKLLWIFQWKSWKWILKNTPNSICNISGNHAARIVQFKRVNMYLQRHRSSHKSDKYLTPRVVLFYLSPTHCKICISKYYKILYAIRLLSCP